MPLDHLVSAYRLPQIVKLDNGQFVEGLRDNDYLLVHSCRQWTTITAHSLEEGHYVIGPKIEIPVHYEGQFKLLDQDRDVKEPVQYFNSVEEVAKAFPERVYVMEEITFNVKMASGECNDDTEVYNITLNTGDELTLMGQAEILYAKTSREKSRLQTIFRKIGKLNAISKLGRGKMPCLICMNHRTNESVSLPFQCRGRFSTCSPAELQMQDGEHTIRDIVEKTRLPVNVAVPGSPPRNPHDLHLIREGHRYKLVSVQTRTVVVCCALRSSELVPVHFPVHLATARCLVPEELLQGGERWLDTTVRRCFSFCQERFDIDGYSRAVRDVRDSEGVHAPHSHASNGSLAHPPAPSALSHARDELARSFQRLSVCVYGSQLHGNSEVDLQGCSPPQVDWALLPSDSGPPPHHHHHHLLHTLADLGDAQHFYTEEPQPSPPPPPPPAPQNRWDVPYEELWLDDLRGQRSLTPSLLTDGARDVGSSGDGCGPTAALPYPTPYPAGPASDPDALLTPPPVPPKSEAVKEECRLMNAPPIPPRSLKQSPLQPSTVATASLSKPRRQETRSPSPTLSYYSSGLHNIGSCEDQEVTKPPDQLCYPCNLAKSGSSDGEPPGGAAEQPSCDGELPTDAAAPSRLSWPNDLGGSAEESFSPPAGGRSYYSYPRTTRSPGAIKEARSAVASSSLLHLDRGDDDDSRRGHRRHLAAKWCSCSAAMQKNTPLQHCHAQQSLSCPVLPPRTPRTSSASSDSSPSSPTAAATTPRWRPPASLAGLSIEEVWRSLRFIGLPDDVAQRFVAEKIDGSLLLQLSEEILAEDFRLSKLQVKKLMQFIGGWRPKI